MQRFMNAMRSFFVGLGDVARSFFRMIKDMFGGSK